MAWNYDAYLPVVTRRESGGNPNARNPRSSASGLFQFLDDTYLSYARRLYPQMSEGALMARKNDVSTQNEVMRAFTEDNANRLKGAGIQLNNGSVYAAHFLGPGGAVKALSASDDTPIDRVVGADAIKANPGVFKNIRTAGDFKRWAGAYGGGAPAEQSASPMALAMQQPDPLQGGGGSDELAGGAGADQMVTAPAAPQSMWDQFLSGGPGALFGAPQEDWNIGDALVGAGSALMARDNPQGAAALASALRYKKDGKTGKKKSLVHGPNGSVHEYDQDTGQTREVIQGQAKEDLPKTGDQKYFGENYDAADKIARATDIFDKHRRRVANGEVDLTVLDRVKQSATELVGTSMTPAQRNAVELALDLEDMRNAKLLEHKGVQTEGDAERAMRSIMPGTGKYNPDAVLTALDRGYNASQRMYSTAINKNDAIVKRWGDKVAHTGYGDWAAGNADRWKKSEEEFAAQRENYYKNRQSQQQHTRETVTGRPQRTQAPQISEGRTATGPNGEKIIFRNGRWEPLK